MVRELLDPAPAPAVEPAAGEPARPDPRVVRLAEEARGLLVGCGWDLGEA